jgi:hypothetical protein
MVTPSDDFQPSMFQHWQRQWQPKTLAKTELDV